MREMPVAVEVKENGFGDWFCGGVAKIVDACTGTQWASNLLKVGDSFAGTTAAQSLESKATNFAKSLPTDRRITRNDARAGLAERGFKPRRQPQPQQQKKKKKKKPVNNQRKNNPGSFNR